MKSTTISLANPGCEPPVWSGGLRDPRAELDGGNLDSIASLGSEGGLVLYHREATAFACEFGWDDGRGPRRHLCLGATSHSQLSVYAQAVLKGSLCADQSSGLSCDSRILCSPTAEASAAEALDKQSAGEGKVPFLLLDDRERACNRRRRLAAIRQFDGENGRKMAQTHE